MKILYVCHRFPFPPKRGGKIRPFNMIKHLSANHEVTVASLARSPGGGEEGRGIAPFCRHFEMAEVTNGLQKSRAWWHACQLRCRLHSGFSIRDASPSA